MKDIAHFCQRRFILRVLLVALLAAGFSFDDRAQGQHSSELSANYGRGVHAYFAHQTELADELFSQVIDAGSTDPRVFYFRAMTRLNSGRSMEAEADMQMGAALEARDPGNRHAIGKALERVQGGPRRTLEEFRQQARMNRLQQRQRQTRDRYEQLQRREPEVLRREAPVPLEDLLEPSLDLPGSAAGSPPRLVPVPAEETDDVIGDPAPARPVPPAEPSDDDPFGSEPAAGDDVFGEPAIPAGETETPVEPEESTAPSDDPFFGEPQSEESPQQPPDEASEDDPFAAIPSSEASSEPADLTAATARNGEAELNESDRIESSQLVGVLGRVAVSVFPWRGIELPSFGPPGGPEALMSEDQPVGLESRFAEEESTILPASAAEPIEAADGSDDLFGETEEPAGDLFGESSEDPFGGAADDEAPAANTNDAEAETPAETESDTSVDDDPFGEF